MVALTTSESESLQKYFRQLAAFLQDNRNHVVVNIDGTSIKILPLATGLCYEMGKQCEEFAELLRGHTIS